MSNHLLPGSGSDEHLFAVGDIHGQARTLEKVLSRIAGIPRTGAPRHLVFTGDVIDRGPENLRSIEMVLNAEEIADVDQVTLLPGNHEIMFLEALREPDWMMSLWAQNGGFSVIDEIDPGAMAKKVGEISELLSDRLSAFIERLDKSPNHLRKGSLLFVHGGILPGCDTEDFLAQPRFGNGDYPEHWAWIREPFLSHEGGWDENGHDVVIHGHTPHNMQLKLDPALSHDFLDRVSTHRRICLDAGASGIGQIGLLSVSGRSYEIDVIQEHDFDPNYDECPLPGTCEIPQPI